MIRPSLEFYSFEKKVNSTLRPTGEYITAMFAEWVEDTPVTSPSFLCNLSDVAMDEINYCYSTLLNRYYWVTDIIWVGNNLYRVNCKCDVLATYGAEIKTSNQYVARSASEYDGRISDGLYPMTTEMNTHFIPTNSSLFEVNHYDTYYILGIISAPIDIVSEDDYAKTYNVGTTNYYLFNKSAMENFAEYLTKDIVEYSEITDYGDGIIKAIVDPYQYIKSIVVLPNVPLALLENSTNVNVVKFGSYSWESTGITKLLHISKATGYPSAEQSVVSYMYDRVDNIQAHPQFNRGSYMNTSPYTITKLIYQPFGILDIDARPFTEMEVVDGYERMKYDGLFINVKVDITTGSAELRVYPRRTDRSTDITYPTEEPMLAYATGSIGISATVHQQGSDVLSYVTNVINIATDVAQFATSASNGYISNVDGALGARSGLTNSIAKDLIGSPRSVGGTSSLLHHYENRNGLYQTFNMVINDDVSDYGRPLMQVRRLGDLTGYVKCEHAHIVTHSGMYRSEAEEIESYLESGVYIE